MPQCQYNFKKQSLLVSLRCNSQENEGEQESHRNGCYQQVGENHGNDDQGEGDNQRKLQEHVKVERQHSVHFLLIFGEAVEDAARRRRVKETHGASDDLRWFANTFVSGYNLSPHVLMVVQ